MKILTKNIYNIKDKRAPYCEGIYTFEDRIENYIKINMGLEEC